LNGEQLAGARDVVGGSEKASRSGLAAFALLDVDHHALASMSQTLSETTSAAGPRHTIRQPAAAAPAAPLDRPPLVLLAKNRSHLGAASYPQVMPNRGAPHSHFE
jgi:hypothetical protein